MLKDKIYSQPNFYNAGNCAATSDLKLENCHVKHFYTTMLRVTLFQTFMSFPYVSSICKYKQVNNQGN